MASDNDWYSDESDETFYRNRRADLHNKITIMWNGICSYEEAGKTIPESWNNELNELIKKYEIQEGFHPITGKAVANGI